jgi:Rieske Fe-S protein
VEIDPTEFKPGELRTVEWRGKPVWLLLRTPAMLDALRGHDELLADPRSDRSEQQPDYARFNLFGPSGIVFFDQNGNEITIRIIGYQQSEQFLVSLDRAYLP